MESDMADIRGGYIYTCPGHEQGKKSVQITNDQTNPNRGPWWEGNGESPSFCKGQQIIIWRCVTSITNAVEKLLKLNYSCKTLNPERANTATPPRASHRPFTHTHTQWKSQRIWKTTGGGEKAPLFFGGGRVKSAYPSANRQQIAMWYTVELMAALFLAPCCRWTAVKIDKMILMNCTWQWNVVEGAGGRGKLHILQHQDQPAASSASDDDEKLASAFAFLMASRLDAWVRK